MLEAGAFPVLLAGGGCAALRAGGLLDVGGEPDALAAAAGAAGWRSPTAPGARCRRCHGCARTRCSSCWPAQARPQASACL